MTRYVIIRDGLVVGTIETFESFENIPYVCQDGEHLEQSATLQLGDSAPA